MAGEVLRPDVTPLPAASVIVVRDSPFEVLLLQRHEKSSFVPGAWVFAGGIAEPADRELAAELSDGSELAAMRVTAVRESFEETGLWLGAPLAGAGAKREALRAGAMSMRDLVREAPLDLDALIWTSRWITPQGLPKRFDTWFFVAAVSRDLAASADQDEIESVLWISPAEALHRHAARAMQMVFPTVRNLEAIASFRTAAELIESRRDAVIEAVEPVLVDGKPTLR
jgi:recombination protein RecT